MSKTLDFIIACIVLAACLFGVLLTPFLAPVIDVNQFPKESAIFSNVHDTPLLANLDDYYQLTQKGQVVITICGEEHQIFLQDLSYDDRKNLQLQLRTP